MNSISTRRRLVAVLLLPFLLVLAGCGKFHADFDIQSADSMNVSFDFAVDTEYTEGIWDSAEALCSEATQEIDLGEDAPPVEPYEENGQYGCTISGVVDSDDFGNGFDLTEENGEYLLTISGSGETVDTSSLESLGVEIDFRMTFTFPGEIIEASGGQIDGNSVTFTDINDISSGIEIRAEANSFPWLIVIGVVLVLGFLLLLAIAAVAFFLIRARRNKGGGSTPTGTPGGYGAAGTAAAAGTAPPAAPQGQPFGQGSPAAPQGGQYGQQPQGGQQWGQASPPPAPHGGQAPQDPQPWNQQPGGQPGQGDQPWNQQPGGQQGQNGQQPPQNPGW